MKKTSEPLCIPVLKGWDRTDHDPIEEYKPSSPSVCFTLALRIGLADSPSGDFYYVTVAPPEGLEELHSRSSDPASGEPIVLSSYSWSQVLEVVGSRLKQCADYGWPRIQDRLRSQFRWEYEDYR